MHNEFYWNTSDQTKIYTQDWTNHKPIKGVVVLVHGVGEHSNRYQHVAEFFTGAGFSMIGMDLRGHGKSGGQRGHFPSFDILMDDIKQFLEITSNRYPSLPVFLYGHSLGANLVLCYTAKRQPKLAGVIATGLAITFAVPPAKLLIGKITYNLHPTMSLSNGLDRSGLSRDQKVVDAYNNDPLVHDRISARLGIDLIQSGPWLESHKMDLKLPLLVMQGSMDRLVNSRATQAFAQSLTSNVTFKLWEGFYHELHNEPEKQEVLTFILNWMNNHLD